jgi:hypothetical protein
MTDMENKEQNPQAPQPAAEPAPAGQSGQDQPAAPQQPAAEQAAPQPDPEQAPAEQPAQEQPAWQKPVPQLTLEPDPVVPSIQFPEPPRAPEPPAPTAQAQQPQPQPVQYATYNYNFNTQPDPNQQPQPGYDPNYQPPNYTAQSYQPQPVQQPKYTTPPPGYQQKSRLAAGLLAFLFGSLGIHNFYLGNNTRGVVQLVVSLAGGLFTCGLSTVAVAIWGMVEAVSLLASATPKFDGNGVILRD